MNFSDILTVLGNPYFTNDTIAIYNMDCKEGLEIMRQHNLQVQATITSPPYNIGKIYEKPMPITTYIDWIADVSQLVYDVTSNHGTYLLNLGYLKVEGKARALPIPYLLWDKMPFFLNQEIIWNYGAGVACKHYLSPRNEKILWYVKDEENYTFNLDAIRDPDVKYPNSKKNGKLRVNTLGKNPSDVWQIAKVTTGANRSPEERTDHPAQFPEDLVQRMVLGFTNEQDIIIDPFLGSGTTASVALQHNRYCIGFEINEAYCETAKRRIMQQDSKLQQDKFNLFQIAV